MHMISLYDYEDALKKRIAWERKEAYEEGFKIGYKESLKRIWAENAREEAANAYALGISIEEITEIFHYPLSTVREWLGLLS